jgi:ethanolamine utilization protein EutJ
LNPALDTFLVKAHAVMEGAPLVPMANSASGREAASTAIFPQDRPSRPSSARDVHVGIDLGTAYTVLAVLDTERQPLAGAYQFAQVVREGLVVDFHGAIRLLQELKRKVEQRLGFGLTSAATTFPPGVALNEVRATRHVVQAAGFECEQAVDEPTAANAVLQVKNGAVVDVGGGTTGIAVFREGKVIYSGDEPTGGTHFSLVIAGARGIAFEEAEQIKKDGNHYRELFPLVRPVMEKVGSIVARHVAAHAVEAIYLVGGTACFPGIDQVVEEVTGIKTMIPGYPLFVTPLGTAMHHRRDSVI